MFGIDLIVLIKTVGYIGIISVIFIESGVFFGFFFPGDSLLFMAGFLAFQGFFDIWILGIGCFIAAIAGVAVGYEFGKKVGPKIFSREDSLFFHKKNIETAEEFYRAHGKKTIVLARFIPVVRTFAPILAGVAGMPYRAFFLYNIGGAAIWVFGLLFSGYYLGRIVPDIDRYLLPIIAAIIAVSFFPAFIHAVRNKGLHEAVKRRLSGKE